MDNTEEFTVLSLCSGYGGLEIGLSRALQTPLRVVAVEIEAFALANLVAKAEEGKLAVEALWPDLRSFPAKKFRGCFDIITAGYPCQPFSHAGKRLGQADPRHLWPYIAEHIRTIRPVLCFFENVSGHLTLGFDEVFKSLRNMGYKVEPGLFTAAEIGAPHKRKRLFILAYAEGSGFGRRRRDNGESGRQGRALQTTGPGELDDTRCVGQTQRQEQSAGIEQSSELADTEKADRRRAGTQTNAGRRNTEIRRCYNNQWPARPGQKQYDWEEPRTVKP